MSKRVKIGRNDPCPCGTTKKYKSCCWGNLDWGSLLGGSFTTNVVPHLSVRGKNRLFLEQVAEALQLDALKLGSLRDFKRTFTPEAVRKIYEATAMVWAGMDDLARGLRSEANKSSALYVGLYDVPRVVRGVMRHSLYSERILLVDPLIHPFSVSDEYNPILNPAEHAQTALKWLWLWFHMAPWIEADLLHFVRTPGDFDSSLFIQAGRISAQRVSESPELRAALRKSLEENTDFLERSTKEMFLRAPDWYLRRTIPQALPDTTSDDVEDIVAAFRRKREDNPFVLEPPQQGAFADVAQMSSGATYEMAKWTASISGSHLVTDLTARWKEIELDYEASGIETRHWSPLAKALNRSDLKALNSIPLTEALRLRQEGRLQSMRDFLGRVWRSAHADDPFDESNAEALSGELRHEIAVAGEEWADIDRELLKICSMELGAGFLASGPMIASGAGSFVAGGIAVSGIGSLIWAQLKRRGFRRDHPAAFFLDLKS